jgi:hypothetical protein
MSELGHSRRSDHTPTTSAYPSIADVHYSPWRSKRTCAKGPHLSTPPPVKSIPERPRVGYQCQRTAWGLLVSCASFQAQATHAGAIAALTFSRVRRRTAEHVLSSITFAHRAGLAHEPMTEAIRRSPAEN